MFSRALSLPIGLFVLLGQTTLADNADETHQGFDQIVVTGARTPLTINQLGSTAVVISRDEIERRQARYASDLLRSIAGFSVSHTGVIGTQTQVRVRGAEANHVLVLIDGVRANDPANNDEFRWENLSTTNIDRIEIVKGPQSALWGSDAVAAVVHIISRKGTEGTQFGTYLEGGSEQTANAGINGNIGFGDWSFSGGVERLTTDGGNISRSGDEDDDSRVTTASISAHMDNEGAMSLEAGLRAVDAYSQFDPVDFFVTGLPIDGDKASDRKNLHAHVLATFDAQGGRLTHKLAAQYFDSENRNLSDGIEDSSTSSDRATISYQTDIHLGSNLLSLAIEHERTRFEQAGEIVFGDPNQQQEMDTTSATVDFQGLSTERLSWLLSARADMNSDFEDAVNGRLSLAYRLSDNINLRGNIGTGRKNPTFIERFGFFPGQFIGNPSLEPERSTSFSIGIDPRFLDDRVIVEISAFSQNLENEINGFVTDPITFLGTAENRDGKSKRNGAEINVNWYYNEWLDLAAHYAYVDSSERDQSGDEVQEVRRPRHSGGLSANFRPADKRWQVALTADYGGSRIDRYFPPFPNPPQIVNLSSYWLLDITAQFAFTDSLSTFVRGTNLLDETYEQVYGYRTPGRAAYVGIRYNYGR